jgi:putative ABC transport system permease protein
VRYLGLIWKNAWRKKIRTSLTILSVFVAFLLFVLLNAIGQALSGGGATLESASRLIVIHKITLIMPLPYAYGAKIAAIPGVDKVSHATWFGGFYQDPKNQFGQFPVEPEEYLEIYPELHIPEEQLQAFLANRTGALLGSSLAENYGLQVGDRIPIQAMWPQQDGSRTWEFDIEGIVTNTSKGGSDAMMLFHYDYFDEARQFSRGNVGWYVLTLKEGANPVEVARAIDAQFENSPAETKTSTETAFAESFMEQMGNIALIVQLILGAVFFTLLLVTGNTMAQSVRERIGELAVLKTVGFRDRTVLGIVLAESILIIAVGGGLGLLAGAGLAAAVSDSFSAMVGIGLSVSAGSLLTAVVIMIAAGVLAGIFPAMNAMRLSIVDGQSLTRWHGAEHAFPEPGHGGHEVEHTQLAAAHSNIGGGYRRCHSGRRGLCCCIVDGQGLRAHFDCRWCRGRCDRAAHRRDGRIEQWSLE